MTTTGQRRKIPIQLGNDVSKVTLVNKSINCKRTAPGALAGVEQSGKENGEEKD